MASRPFVSCKRTRADRIDRSVCWARTALSSTLLEPELCNVRQYTSNTKIRSYLKLSDLKEEINTRKYRFSHVISKRGESGVDGYTTRNGLEDVLRELCPRIKLYITTPR